MWTNEDLYSKWETLRANQGNPIHQGYDATHPLRIHFGYDTFGNREFFLITDYLPNKLPAQGNAITFHFGKRNDGLNTVVLTLTRPEQSVVFIQLCWDLAESCRNCTDDKSGTERMITRFMKWQHLMEQGLNGLLSSSAIKGLIGELIFLTKDSLTKYDPVVAVDGWMGPEASDRDFVYSIQWYEIKTIDPGASIIKISSVEQLDTNAVGELVVVLMEKTSSSSANKFSLNGLVEKIRSSLAVSPQALDNFEDKLLEAGYITRNEYGVDFYSLINIRRFKVNSEFPRIRRNMLSNSIVKVQYELAIASIVEWEILDREMNE